jgi:hypothetical protein
VYAFSPVVGIGTTPLPQVGVPHTPFGFFWGEGTLACGRGGWAGPNSDEGTLCTAGRQYDEDPPAFLHYPDRYYPSLDFFQLPTQMKII